MNLIRPNNSPVKDVFQDFINSAFNRTLSDYLNVEAPLTQPSVNIKETADDFKIELAAPGLEKSDFNLTIEKDKLHVSAQKEEKKEENSDNFTKKEFSFNSFTRSFDLPNTLITDKVVANYENGILTIQLPKKPEAKPQPAKQIEIK